MDELIKDTMERAEKLYKCEICGGIYERGWTEEEATEEAKKHGWDVGEDPDSYVIVCDDCYKKVMGGMG